MKKISAYILLLFLLVFFVSACGKNDDFTSSSTAESYLTMQVRVDAGNKKLIVDWQMNGDADYYTIYYIPDASNTYSESNKPSTATMKAGSQITKPSAARTITGLTNGTKYWIAVTAYNSIDGESYITSPISATPTSTATPTAPENVRANAGDAQVTVTWTPVTDAVSYIIVCYYYDISTGSIETDEGYIDVDGQASNSQVVSDVTWYVSGTTTTLENDRAYYFSISAVNEDGVLSASSFIDSATPSTSPPPTAPVVTDVTAGDSEITITWNPVTASPAVTSYNIYIGKGKGVTQYTGQSTPISADASNPYEASATDLTNDTKYYIVVTAVNSNGESADSTEWWATPASGGGSSGEVE